jgi:hypothetical protein
MLAFFVILGFPECIWCGTLEEPLITIIDKNFEPRYFVCYDCLDVHGGEF